MHRDFKLYTTKNSYVVAPVQSELLLLVNREDGNLQTTDKVPSPVEQESTSYIYGLMGFIQLLSGNYMLTITERELVGSIVGKNIYRIGSFQILPLAKNLDTLTEQEKEQEQYYVSLLESHLRTNTFYFSYDYDLTQSAQRQNSLNPTDPLFKRADERFFWNKFVSTKLSNAEMNLSEYILPVMQGFVEINQSKINGKEFSWGLITRRSRHRPGTRYFSRGIDENGHVSNFVETEQFVTYEGAQLAFVQTRGSIPVYWAQIINLKYTPKLWIGETRRSLAAARAHFDEQIRFYGTQTLVNLVNKKGYELPMCQAYARTVEQLNDPRIHYIHFDFHAECSKMRWHRIDLLIDQLKETLNEQGYFYSDANGEVKKTQSSVVRTNCMDCLDRTNVVQSTIARWVLTQQLRKLGILKPEQKTEDQEGLMSTYRNVWADNADGVSCVYSGTGALKTDFTRTGQRTKAGALQDLQNSIVRYCKNNFMDGFRQDTFDLFLGKYTVGKGSLFDEDERPLRIRVVPYIMLFALFMFFTNVIRPSYSGFQSVTSYMLLLLFWISVLISGIRFAVKHGNQFVQWPRLLELPSTEEIEEIPTLTEKDGDFTPPEFAQ
ncbi:SacI homology domain-containing protein [Sporodiniella umbellata]|nr:SacI homology domain-containing protein [Sporodiniella umbellata]